MSTQKRSKTQFIKDLITFPIRAVTIFEDDKWGLSSLRTERFDYVSKEVRGYCLDVGCGRHNLFINSYLNGKGKGIDVYKYEGLTRNNLLNDISKFPFKSKSFETITFIANINHIPKKDRDTELKEAYRCLSSGGNIVVTMGNPIAEIMVHKVVHLYDKIFGTNHDMDSERGMHDEDFYLTDKEIKIRLKKAGFKKITKKYFVSQWGLNHLFIGWKNR